uniref:DUF4939 domain-containing protein n=1 Tax=Mastacembelus armatus TaxID=205130 RepID=A0A3Q3RR28_9TELE
KLHSRIQLAYPPDLPPDPSSLSNIVKDLLTSLVVSFLSALASYEAQLLACVANLDKLTQQISKITLGAELMKPQDMVPVPAPSQTLHGTKDTPICLPERYSGEPSSCAFLIQCNLKYQPSAFPNDSSKVVFILSLLSDPVREWGVAEMNRDSSICNSLEDFSKELINTFDPAKPRKEATIQLARLTQGDRPVSEYAVEFRTLATTCRLLSPAHSGSADPRPLKSRYTWETNSRPSPHLLTQERSSWLVYVRDLVSH